MINKDFVLAFDGVNTFVGIIDKNHKSRVRVDYHGNLDDLIFYDVEWNGSNPWKDGWKDGECDILTFDVVDWT